MRRALVVLLVVVLTACSDDDPDTPSTADGPITGAEVTEVVEAGPLAIELVSVSEPRVERDRRVLNLEVRVEVVGDDVEDLPDVALECGGVATPTTDGTTYDPDGTLDPGGVAEGFVVATLPDDCDLPEVVASTDPEVRWPLSL